MSLHQSCVVAFVSSSTCKVCGTRKKRKRRKEREKHFEVFKVGRKTVTYLLLNAAYLSDLVLI